MVEAHHGQPVVIFGMQGKVADDGDAHADGDVPLDHLGVVHFKHHVVVDAALAESLFHAPPAQALRAVQNQRELCHILNGDRVPMQQLMAGLGDEHHVVVEQFREFQGRIISRRSGAQGEVNLPGLYQLNQVGIGTGDQPHTHVRVSRPELSDGARQVVGNDVGVSAHDEGAASLGVVHLGFQGVDGLDNGRHQFIEQGAFGSKLDGTLDAVEQGDTELALQLAEVSGNRGLPKLQLASRLGYAPQAGYVVKADNLSQFHGRSTFHSNLSRVNPSDSTI